MSIVMTHWRFRRPPEHFLRGIFPLFVRIRMPALCSLLVLLAVALAGRCESADLFLKNVQVEENRVVASFSVPGLLGKEEQARLASGAQYETTVRFYLFAERDLLPDEQLDRSSLKVRVVYNATTEEYAVTRTLGALVTNQTVRSREEARQLVEEFENIPVFTSRPGWKGRRAFIRARAFLGTRYLLGVIPNQTWTDKTSSRHFTLP